MLLEINIRAYVEIEETRLRLGPDSAESGKPFCVCDENGHEWAPIVGFIGDEWDETLLVTHAQMEERGIEILDYSVTTIERAEDE
jgi:hypothetical protein